MTSLTHSKFNPFFWLRRVYHWVLGWSEHRHGIKALFGIAFMESSFFPIPPDVLLMALCAGQPKKAFRFAAICSLGSVLGGVAGYAIGMGLWHLVSAWFFAHVPGFTPEVFQKVADLYQENAFLTVFTAAFTPIPYKVITIGAGVAQISVLTFILGSVIGRSARFFLVAASLYFFGPKMKELVEKYFELFTVLFTVLLGAGFYVIKVIAH